MKGQRRRSLDAHSWRELLKRFEGAGKTVSEFCAREGVCVSSFYRWRSELRSHASRAGALAPARHTPATKPMTVEPTGSFIDLGSLGRSAQSGVGALELRLDLGGGVVLQIVRR
jgi:putative transposase